MSKLRDAFPTPLWVKVSAGLSLLVVLPLVVLFLWCGKINVQKRYAIDPPFIDSMGIAIYKLPPGIYEAGNVAIGPVTVDNAIVNVKQSWIKGDNIYIRYDDNTANEAQARGRVSIMLRTKVKIYKLFASR